MGRWRIVLEGEGPCHADHPADADMIGERAVLELRKGGHRVTRASFDYPPDDCDLLERAKAAELRPTPVRPAAQTEGS